MNLGCILSENVWERLVNLFKIGDRVKVIEQDIWGEIVRMDEVKAVVLDDDRDEWMEEDEEGTLIFRLSELEREG